MISWKAVYGDDDSLHQFSGDQEHLFKEIDLDRLLVFRLEDTDYKVVIDVDVLCGVISVNGVIVGEPACRGVKLIYFRRNKVDLNVGARGITSGLPEIEFHAVGFEYIDGDMKTKRYIRYINNTINMVDTTAKINPVQGNSIQ